MRLRRENGDFTLTIDATNSDDIHGTWPKSLFPEQFIGEIVHVKMSPTPTSTAGSERSIGITTVEQMPNSDIVSVIAVSSLFDVLYYNRTTGEVSANKNAAPGGTSDAEVVAARSNSDTGQTYSTLGTRLDTEYSEIKADLDDNVTTASAALTKANTVDERLNNIVIESGTSDAEVVAARTNSDTGQTYSTLGTRLDTEYSEIKEELLQKAGLSDEAKQALLACFAKVAWIDEHGQTYYDALEDALYPPAELVRISCVYTQSKTVYYASSLNKLKSDLIVTAYMSDGTTRTITDYELSGTLTVGTSVITVTHGGKVATFSVTVTQPPYTWRYSASSGKLLSEESYFNNVNIDSTCTEKLVNGVLELSAPPSSAPEPALQYYLTPATNVHAAVKFKIKYIEIPQATGTAGFRVILSDGSEGSRIGVRKDRSSGKYKLCIRAGSTDIDILELELNTWYEMLLEKNGQNTIVTLDGTEVYNSNTPATSSAIENRILNQSTNRGNSIVDIEYIEYYNYDYDTEE